MNRSLRYRRDSSQFDSVLGDRGETAQKDVIKQPVFDSLNCMLNPQKRTIKLWYISISSDS